MAQDGLKNFLASVLIDDKKIGQVQYTARHNEIGELEELHTRASFSVFGIKLYDFSQQLHEQWAGSELSSVTGNTNDDGTLNAVTVRRTPAAFLATLNGASEDLPLGAFPMSFWHYAITKQSLLFDPSDLSLKKVSVARHDDTVRHGKASVATERFDFSGDWKGSVWFDANRQFLKAQYETNGRQVTVLLEPET